MVNRNNCTTLDLRPGCLNLELYHGVTDLLSVWRRDTTTQAQLPLTGWTNERAVIRRFRGGPVVVDLAPSIVGDAIEIDITPTMKSALGSEYGVWEVDIDGPDGKPVTLVHGTVQIDAQVVTS